MQLKQYWLQISIYLTIFIELITCLFRFGFNMASSQNTKFIANITFGIRIHHGYIGILFLIYALVIHRQKSQIYYLFLVIGLSLLFSDLVHHFLVLWPITGHPQFDLFYPK
ncbi:hypothetical protein [Candidatus Uabimicrobium sp. HlEnr_7]|uniref:hypothetical protein n=1 Tax=Candidatus Uabimicrobium helgolandensis TaxID=3095367 RepID=UPI003556E342